MMSQCRVAAFLVALLLVAGCSGDDAAVFSPPDDITPPAGVVETTALPREAADPVTVPGPLNEDGLGYLIHSYLPDHVGEAGSGGDVFCAYEVFGWQLQTDTATAWLWVYCEEFFYEAEEGTAFSAPVTIHLSELPAGWIVSFAERSELGSLYEESVRNMFPSEFADRALDKGSSRDLSAEVRQAARNHGG